MFLASLADKVSYEVNVPPALNACLEMNQFCITARKKTE